MIDANTVALDKYLNEIDKVENLQEAVISGSELARQEAMNAIDNYVGCMNSLSEEYGLTTDWYNIKEELELE